jgi:hypothetical protein
MLATFSGTVGGQLTQVSLYKQIIKTGNIHRKYSSKLHICTADYNIMVYVEAQPAFEGGKWGDRPRPRSWVGLAFQA